jgi:hypothetical protein
MKKCPVCGSSRFRKSDVGMRCEKCGYLHIIDSKKNAEWVEFDKQ